MLNRRYNLALRIIFTLFISIILAISSISGLFIENQFDFLVNSYQDNNNNSSLQINQLTESNCNELSRWDEHYGGLYDFEIVEKNGNLFAYLAVGEGLLILDLTNPSKPKIAGEFLDGYKTNCITMTDDYVYISGKDSGFRIFDIINPTKPKLIFKDYTFPEFQIMTVVSDCIYASTNGDDYLHILDISVQGTTDIIEQCDLSLYNINDFFLVNRTLYINDDFRCLVYNVDNLLVPKLINIFNFDYYSRGIVIDGNLLINYDYQEKVSFYDISDSTNFTLLNYFIDRSFYIYDAIIQNDIVFLIGFHGIKAINISDFSKLSIATEFKLATYSYFGIIRNNRLFLLENNANLRILYFSEEECLIYHVGKFFCGCNIESVHVQDDIALLQDNFGFFLIDISNPLKPKTKGIHFLDSTYYFDTRIEGDFAYCLTYYTNIIEIIDISKPSVPVKTAEISLHDFGPLFQISFDIKESNIYIMATYYNSTIMEQETCIRVYNCQNHSNIVFEKRYRIDYLNVDNLFLYKDYLIMNDYSQFLIYNIVDGKLNQFSNFTMQDTYEFTINKDMIFLTKSNKDLTIINISNPSNPTIINTFDDELHGYYLNRAYNIFYENHHVYLEYGTGGILIINAFDLGNLKIVGHYRAVKKYNQNTGLPTEYFQLSDIFVQDNIAYIVSSEDGLFIMHLDSLPVNLYLSERNTTLVTIFSIIGVTLIVAIVIIVRIIKRR